MGFTYLWRGLALVAVLVGLYGAISAYGGYHYRQGYAAAVEAQRVAELEGFRETARRLIGLDNEISAKISDLAKSRPEVIKEVQRVQIERPLPAGCILDFDRLRAVNNAINAAAAARDNQKPLPNARAD